MRTIHMYIYVYVYINTNTIIVQVHSCTSLAAKSKYASIDVVVSP